MLYALILSMGIWGGGIELYENKEKCNEALNKFISESTSSVVYYLKTQKNDRFASDAYKWESYLKDHTSCVKVQNLNIKK